MPPLLPNKEEIKDCERCKHFKIVPTHCLCTCHLAKLFPEKGEVMKYSSAFVMCYPEEVEAMEDFLNS